MLLDFVVAHNKWKCGKTNCSARSIGASQSLLSALSYLKKSSSDACLGFELYRDNRKLFQLFSTSAERRAISGPLLPPSGDTTSTLRRHIIDLRDAATTRKDTATT